MNKDKKFKLDSFFLISMVAMYIVLSLIQSNVFNLSQTTQLIVVSILTILSSCYLIAMSLCDSIGILLMANFLLFYVLFASATIVKPSFFQYKYIPLKIYLAFFISFLILFFINISIITVKLNTINKPVLIPITNPKIKNNIFFISINKLDYLLNSLLYKIRALFPIFAYITAIIIVIINFTILYEASNLYLYNNDLEEGLFYSQLDENNKRIRAVSHEPLYFSTCTFLNTNDGSIIPIGNSIKLLVQLEMLLAHVMNIIFIPTLLFFYFKIFENKSITCNNKSKKCIYNATIDQDSLDTSNRRNTRRKMRKSRNC